MEWEDDLDFIIAYLDQARKMNHEPQKITEILLYLSKEFKKVKMDNKCQEKE